MNKRIFHKNFKINNDSVELWILQNRNTNEIVGYNVEYITPFGINFSNYKNVDDAKKAYKHYKEVIKKDNEN